MSEAEDSEASAEVTVHLKDVRASIYKEALTLHAREASLVIDAEV